MSSPVRVTAARTIGRARNLFSTAFAIAGFLAVSALFFAFRIEGAEGGTLSVSVEWALSVSFVLPALVALLAMDVWCDERQTGRIDNLLTLAVFERDYVFGKFFGVLVLTMAAIVLSLAVSFMSLAVVAPGALAGVGFGSLLAAIAAVTLQSVLWCAVSVALSAMFRHVATVVCAAFSLMIVLPRGIWAGLMSWSASGRPAFGGFPLDDHVVDIASGIVPVGTVAAYLVGSAVALFVATKCVAAYRFAGKGLTGVRVSTHAAIWISVVVAAMTVSLVQKVNPVVDIPVSGSGAPLSQRTRSILAETSGNVLVTVFLSRGDVRFRPVGRMLRRLQRESESLGGGRITLNFVDPRWDIGSAERLVRHGVKAESVVFEKGRRLTVCSLDEGFGERPFASALRRISSQFQRRNVYWTVGHGESAFDAYDAFGMSDIARELFREGFRNEKLDLASAQQIPGDCALILIAGAKDDFSRVEIGRIDAYLKGGGRLLVLQGTPVSGGISSLLPSWGIRASVASLEGEKTISGSDVVVSGFTDHPIADPLKGSRIVLERPASFAPSAVIGTVSGADSIEFRPVAKTESAVLAAAVERGGGSGADVAFRPTRIVTIGDSGFALNGVLSSRASANRDFFMNCVAYLSGVEAHGSGDDGSMVFKTGLDRQGRMRHAVATAVVMPLVVFLLLAVVASRRKLRK